MKTPTHNIVYRPIDEIHELKNNPRIIKKDQFEKLKTSIKDNPDYFEARPCILSNRTGVLVVIAGNQRLRASRELGLTEIPTVLLEGLDEDREAEIIARDNVENGEWDYDILANEWEIEKLNDWGVETPWTKDEGFGTDFSLPDGEKGTMQTMSFTLSDEQAEFIKSQMALIEDTPETFGNTNKHGNQLYEIVKQWAEQRK